MSTGVLSTVGKCCNDNVTKKLESLFCNEFDILMSPLPCPPSICLDRLPSAILSPQERREAVAANWVECASALLGSTSSAAAAFCGHTHGYRGILT